MGNCLAYKVEISERKEITSVELRYSKALKGMFLIFLAILVFMNILFPILVQIGDAYDYSIWGVVLLLAVTLLCFFFCLELYTWYQVDEQGIRNHSIWRRHFSLSWEAIDSIADTIPTFAQRTYGVTVEGGGHKFVLRDYMDGWSEFSYLVRKHLPKEKWDMAEELIPRYDQSNVPDDIATNSVAQPPEYSEQPPQAPTVNGARPLASERKKRKNPVLTVLVIVVLVVVIGAVVNATLGGVVQISNKTDVTYNYSATVSKTIKFTLSSNPTTTVTAGSGYSYVVLEVKVHNQADAALYISPDSFLWRSQGIETDRTVNTGSNGFWYSIDPNVHPTSGYVQKGTTWNMEIIFEVEDYMTSGTLVPNNSTWASDSAL